MRLRLPVTLLGLLLPVVASHASRPERYQLAMIQDRNGMPCFSVPDTRQARAHVPSITGISVMEVGKGGTPVWERDFLREGSVEPMLAPGQCLDYRVGAEIPMPALQVGKRYQVEMWGHAPSADGQAQSRWFNGYFCVVDTNGHLTVKQVMPGGDGAPRWDECLVP